MMNVGSALAVLMAAAIPISFEGLLGSSRAILDFGASNSEKCACEAGVDLSRLKIDRFNPGACGNCEIRDMPSQTRCVNSMWTCTTGGGQNWLEKRDRWKWICPDETFISCGGWYGLEICCATIDPGPSCAGNSGLRPCIGVPYGYTTPGTE